MLIWRSFSCLRSFLEKQLKFNIDIDNGRCNIFLI
jgi:hypothetical protein